MNRTSQGIIDHGSLENYIDHLENCILLEKSKIIEESAAKIIKQSNTSYKYKTYQKRAFEKNMEMNITFEDFEVMIQLSCNYCGQRSTGLDRVDSKKGYTYDNSVPCCRNCNMMKNVLSIEEFINHVRRIMGYNAIQIT